MGIPISILGKLGLPGVDSVTTDQVYAKYFGDKNIKNVNEFYEAFISLFNDFNAIMPGKHYKLTASRKEIQEIFDEWFDTKSQGKDEGVGKEKKDVPQQSKKTPGTGEGKSAEKKKDAVVEFMKKHVAEYKTSSTAMIWVGATDPGATVLLKKSGENVPQVKKLRLDRVPNVVLVPTFTMLSLIVVRTLPIIKASRTTS